jgi:hypothetical protein
MGRTISHAMQWVFLLLFAIFAILATFAMTALVAQAPAQTVPSQTAPSPTTPTLSFPTTPFTTAPLTTTQSTKQLKESATAAEQWLALVDDGKYNMSWNSASPRLQLVFPRDSWTTYLRSARVHLGKLQTRTIAQQSPAENPEGLAPGHYMVILYNTTFPGQKATQELVTLGLENNTWRVLSYNIGTIE